MWKPQSRPSWWPLEDYVNKQMDNSGHLRQVYHTLAAIARRALQEGA